MPVELIAEKGFPLLKLAGVIFLLVWAHQRRAAGVDVLVLIPHRMWRSATTDEHGRPTFHLDAGHLPTTMFVTGDGFALHEELAWIPDECALHTQLTMRREGGACIVDGATPVIEVDVVVKWLSLSAPASPTHS